uniref:Endonuclease/exonuclease/phosphatase domain-containing protein n=1 Tax=Latimeria chalumnae TaxID=7897 RepID=H3B0G3_LATCH
LVGSINIFSSYPWCYGIVGGNFNCLLDTFMDRSSSIPLPASQSQTAKATLAFTEEYSLIDSWCHMHTTSREYSSSLFQFPILSYKLVSYEFLPHSISDHLPICVLVEVPDCSLGPIRWRFSSHLLTKNNFTSELCSAISEFFVNKSPSSSPNVIWEAFKATIRGKIIATQQLNLELCLKKPEIEHYKINSAETREQVALLQHELNTLSTIKAEHDLLHVNSKHYAQGDKASKLLTWQLRWEETERFILTIQMSDASFSCIPKDINQFFTSFHSSLYTTKSQGVVCLLFLDKLEFPTLSEDTKAALDLSLTQSEILSATDSSPEVEGV